MPRCDHRVDAAADVEVGHHLDEVRLERRDEVVEDPVGHRLVKDALVPIGPQVEFEALQLNTAVFRYIPDPDGGEVGLAGHGADAGELRARQVHDVRTVGHGIVDGLQLSGWLGGQRLPSCVRDAWIRPAEAVDEVFEIVGERAKETVKNAKDNDLTVLFILIIAIAAIAAYKKR